MPYATICGKCIFYLRRPGRDPVAPAVLFIHGAGGNALLWGRVLQHLPRVSAIAVDLPGHGRSAGPGCTAIAAYSQAVLALAEALHLERLVLAGHSMGGAVALDLALNAPWRLQALVLVAVAAPLPVAPALLQQLAEDPAPARQWIIDAGYGPGIPAAARELGAKQLAQVAPAVLHGDFLACSAYDARPRLAEISAPALLLCGSEDRLTPPRRMQALRDGLPKSRLEIVPGAGHMLPLERPEAVGEAISRLLASL